MDYNTLYKHAKDAWQYVIDASSNDRRLFDHIYDAAFMDAAYIGVNFDFFLGYLKYLYSEEDAISALKAAIIEYLHELNPEAKINDVYLHFEGELKDIFLRKPSAITEQDVGKFRCIEGTITQVYQPIMKVSKAAYVCAACGAISKYKIDMNVDVFHHTYCPTCQKNNVLNFSPDYSEYKIIQYVNLQDTEQATQHIVPVLLSGPLVNKVEGGQRVRVQGIVRIKRPKATMGGGFKAYSKVYIEATSVQALNQSFDDITLTKEDIETIKDLAKRDDVLDYLTRSISPSIYGYEDVKLSILLQQFGGVTKKKPDGTTIRGRIHILLCGEPGVAKSQLLRWVATNLPKTKYSTGKGSSGVGLTATVNRETGPDGSGHWVLSVGALPLSSGGTLCIDEFDKMTNEDRDHMQTAMEQGVIAIDKADIHTELAAESSILAAANPKYRRYDPSISLAENLNLPSDLLTRFDIIFHVRDRVDKEKDRKLARHILEVHDDTSRGIYDNVLDVETLTKYISYARKLRPKLTSTTKRYIEDIYIGMRNNGYENDSRISFTARQLEALIRLSTACAKLHLREEVLPEDVDVALKVIKGYIASVVGLHPGDIVDIDQIMTDISYKDRSIIKDSMTLLREHGEMEENTLYDILKTKGYKEEEINHAMKQLHTNGDINYTADGKLALVRG